MTPYHWGAIDKHGKIHRGCSASLEDAQMATDGYPACTYTSNRETTAGQVKRLRKVLEES